MMLVFQQHSITTKKTILKFRTFWRNWYRYVKGKFLVCVHFMNVSMRRFWNLHLETESWTSDCVRKLTGSAISREKIMMILKDWGQSLWPKHRSIQLEHLKKKTEWSWQLLICNVPLPLHLFYQMYIFCYETHCSILYMTLKIGKMK